MAFEWEFEATVGSGSSLCHSKYIIRSNGWSGNVVKTSSDTQEERTFKFQGKMTISGSQDGTLETEENAYVERNEINVSYIGISLEHFGEYWNTNWPDNHTNQIVGSEPLGGTANNSYEVPSYGAKSTDTDPTFQAMNIISEGYTNNIEQQTYGATRVTNIAIGTVSGYRGLMSCEMRPYNGGGWVYDLTVEIETDLPIFETDADLMAYCNSRGEDTSKIANIADPEEDYETARKYNYIWNIYGHNANNATQYTGYRNYRFYGGNGKICLYRVKATAGSPYTVKLANYSSYTVKAAEVYDADDEDYETIENPELYFLHESIQFTSSNYYKVFKWLTDLLIFGSQSEAEMWARDEIDARQAENFNKVSRVYDLIVDPEYGNPDAGYDNGTNGQSYVHGARLWVMSSTQLNNFFDDIFDPLHISDLLDGTKLFGSNEIGAIQGIAYYPIDINDVATVNGTDQAIKIGSYTCPTATGKYVWNNNKMINCGSVFIAPVYNDFRDMQIRLFISLPYCGFHELNPISKYMGKNLEVYYAVDITTGACSAHVLADGISYGDVFDGFMSSQRPLTALDQTAYLNSVMGCVSSIVNRESGMISEAKGAIAGVATGNAGQVAKGGSSFSGLNTSFGAISDLYGLSQATREQPMSTRGGFAGCLGFFGNQKIHIITAQSKTVKPLLEQQIVGYPSHVSQRVGNFSGYLKCSAINMTNFSGTAQELADIHDALSKGIYL